MLASHSTDNHFQKSLLHGSEVQSKLRKLVRQKVLQDRATELLSNVDLDKFWKLASSHAIWVDGDQRIEYKDFKLVEQQLEEKFHKFFRPCLFFRLSPDAEGRISLVRFFNFVVRKASLDQARVELCYYDEKGSGYLTEKDLCRYFEDIIPKFPKLRYMDAKFVSIYIQTAIRKLFFFLDNIHRGHLYIRELLGSPILSELFELRDENLSPEFEQTNWFSEKTAQRIYDEFMALDIDQSFTLNIQELSRFGRGTLTPAFLSRLFDQPSIVHGEMNYRSFLEFLLSMANKKSIPAIRYFFRLLDIRQLGYLDEFTLNYFLRDILVLTKQEYHQNDLPFHVIDIINEIFDMVKVSYKRQITCDDLIKSQVGDSVISILTDAQGFWEYDNREAIAYSNKMQQHEASNVDHAADTPAHSP